MSDQVLPLIPRRAPHRQGCFFRQPRAGGIQDDLPQINVGEVAGGGGGRAEQGDAASEHQQRPGGVSSGAPAEGGIAVGDLVDPLSQGPQVGVGCDGSQVGEQRPSVVRAFTLSRAADLYSHTPGAHRAVAVEPTTTSSCRLRG